ncbi:MAG: class I tRNA ligase family protein [bacterium]|nr:class I tRNA ligase family protein [bacterium]
MLLSLNMADEKQNTNKSAQAEREEKILEFWREHKVFEKSLEKDSPKGEFIFYEGPPTANGKPGIHHLEARAFKDAIPRYKTMQGFHVRRKGGWDTHGLPVELQVEKKLGLNSKKAIEEYGIAKFNKECKESVWEYVDLWEKFTDRIGYWVDQKNPYVTYHNEYIESVWNVLKKVDDQKLLYKDYKIVPWCSRCGTALSSHELAQGYEDVKDLSITAKFKIVGFPNAYFLAWTTTPWTLPGNVALAVGANIIYVEVKVNDEILVLAKERLSVIEGEYEIIAEHKGSEMVGMQYEPLFPYLTETISESEKIKLEKAFKVYLADFVNTTDGTGIVHTAVMYGADDFDLGTNIGLPKHHLVNLEGKFIIGTDFLEGRFVKEKDNSIEGKGKPTLDVDIIKYLQEKNLFFKKELYEHSYPHCWRCKTALIYYARDSWYIRMSDPSIKEKMIQENKKINWEPEYTKEGRFGEWLAGIKDWAISRERYWGTPLPVWSCLDCKKVEAIGSIEELKSKTKKSGNKYFVMRHGETDANTQGLVSTVINSGNNLTEKGVSETKQNADILLDKKIDMVFISPFNRTKETAKIVAEVLNLKEDQIVVDARLGEVNIKSYEGRTWSEYHQDFPKTQEYWDKNREGDESYKNVKSRVAEFIFEIEEKYKDKNILIITHGGPAWILVATAKVLNINDTLDLLNQAKDFHYFQNSEIQEINFVPLPCNTDYELDLHKPYIDEVGLACECGEVMTRTKEVMDVWFDSGAMPFAQDHYPFNSEKLLYPADFICEAIDQTRGWFYTLHAVGVLMGKGLAYKNVICLGHILDEKGKKMSKSLGNIVDPWMMMDKYGVDTLRLWMYGVNQPGESKNFDEKTVQLLNQQVFGLLYNILSFYELYRDKALEVDERKISDNILDQWILSRLSELILNIEKQLDNYKLLEPVRAMRDFINDLSTWYLRRSRERIKDGDENAKRTLYFVLKNLIKVMAPFAPFASEDIWQKLKNENDEMSVHLCEWPYYAVATRGEPKIGVINFESIEEMQIVRDLVSTGLQLRQKNNIPVRQPLQSLTIINSDLNTEYLEIIKDELNIKEIIVDSSIDGEIMLDTNITPELKQEGNYRELLRSVQDMRKKMGLIPSDMVMISIDTDEDGKGIVDKWQADFMKTTGVKEVKIESNNGEEVKIGELVFKIQITK